MSFEKFSFPTMASLHEESASLYHELRAFVENQPDGLWSYVYGYDPSGDGTRYDFVFVDTARRKTELNITAVKDGPHFSFMIASKSNV